MSEPSENATVTLREALAQTIARGEKVLRLPAGRLDLYPAGCSERYCYFSNNDEGVKTIALDLADLENFTLVGEATELIFHGRVSPLVATRCRNLTIADISIDFADSFVSDADIVKRENGIAWLQIGGKHHFADGKLGFTGDFYDNLDGVLRCFAYNASRRELSETAATSIENHDLLYRDGLVGVPDRFPAGAQELIIKHELRLCPGIVLDNCQNVVLKNVKLHHASGMGILAQCCCNVTLEKVEISPRRRRASVSDDGAHLVECRGKISLRDCDFAGMLDDSVNIHGIYRPLKFRIPGGKFYYLDTGHYQQAGIPGAQPGDTLELAKPDTGKPYGKIKLTDAKLINKAFTRVTFDENTLPPEYEWGDAARVVECAKAEVEIVNCRFRPYRGRGILVSGVKSANIKNCEIHSSGAAIFVSGDPRFWFESGRVDELCIENNTFDNCNYSNTAATREPVCVFPEIAVETPGFFYHGRIALRGNRFIAAKRPLLSFRSVETVEIVGNQGIEDTTYPFAPQGNAGYFFTTPNSPAVNFRDCGKTTVEGNRFFEE